MADEETTERRRKFPPKCEASTVDSSGGVDRYHKCMYKADEPHTEHKCVVCHLKWTDEQDETRKAAIRKGW